MTGYVVEIAPAAEGDIRDAFLWYRERNALIAHAFRAETFDAIEQVGKTPLGKAADDEGNRRRVLHRFPYSVVHEVTGNTVTVLTVCHHRRKPGHWKAWVAVGDSYATHTVQTALPALKNQLDALPSGRGFADEIATFVIA